MSQLTFTSVDLEREKNGLWERSSKARFSFATHHSSKEMSCKYNKGLNAHLFTGVQALLSFTKSMLVDSSKQLAQRSYYLLLTRY